MFQIRGVSSFMKLTTKDETIKEKSLKEVVIFQGPESVLSLFLLTPPQWSWNLTPRAGGYTGNRGRDSASR